MKIRMLATAASPEGVLDAGKVYELPRDKAEAFILARAARPAEAVPIRLAKAVELESATIEPPERTTKPAAVRRRDK